MLKFVEKVQQNEPVSEIVPQYRLSINKITKQLSATEVKSIYSNHSNDKRYYNSSAHPSKLWAYGTTRYS